MSDVFDDVTIPAGGFVLRPLRVTDAADVVASCQDLLTRRWIPLPDPYTERTALAFISDKAPEQHASGRGIVRAVDIDGRLCGVIDLMRTDWRTRTTEMGYWVSPWARGRGLAGRAARCLADWTIADQQFERVVIRAATGNVPSRRAALTAGFVSEGVARSAGLASAGRVDLEVFSRIREDLPSR